MLSGAPERDLETVVVMIALLSIGPGGSFRRPTTKSSHCLNLDVWINVVFKKIKLGNPRPIICSFVFSTNKHYNVREKSM